MSEEYSVGYEEGYQAGWNAAIDAYTTPQPVSQEPVAVVEITYGREPECYVTGNVDDLPEGVFKLYTAPQPVSQEPCKECGAKQAQIDRLMLEYCPDEMTQEQVAEWAANQQPVSQEPVSEALAEQAEQEPVSWIYEDELPKGYPYDEMFSRSKIIEGVRMFPEVQTEQSTVKDSLTAQEPVAVVEITYGREPECYVTGNIDDFPEGVFKLYTHPVRTKDLTDDEIWDLWESNKNETAIEFYEAIIAAYKEKNK